MFSKAVAASLGRKGKFGFLWLAATVGSHERSLPKSDLIKLDLTKACEEIAAGDSGLATPSPSPSSSDLSSEFEGEEDDEEGGKKRKAKKTKKKKKKPVKRRKKKGAREEEGEKVVIGLRLSANLMLGVCRVYDYQVSATSSDATHLFLALRPMLNDFVKGGKAGVAGGPRRLDMPDDGGARANTSNLDAPEENMVGFGLDFGMAAGFGGEEWENLNFGEPISSVGKAMSLSQSTRTGEEEEEEEDEEGERARGVRGSRKASTIGSPSRINLQEPHLYAGSDHRASQGAMEVEFEPGVELGLGLLGDDEMAINLDGGASGWGARPGSSSVGGLGLGGDDGYQYPDDGAGFDFGADDGGQPMDGIDESMIPVGEKDATESSLLDDESSLASILKGPASGKPKKKKKTVRLAKMDDELTYPDHVIKGWRKDYVKSMLEQGNAAKEKQAEKSAKEAAVGLLQGIPVGGVQAPELVNLVLGQQNQKKSFVTTPKPRTKRKKKRVSAAGEGSETEEGEEAEDGQQQQPFAYPDDFGFDMGDVQPMGEGDDHMERYVDYSIPLKGDDTRRSEEDESEVGRRAGSSRKSSSAPWDSVQRRGRESSVGLLGDGGFGPGSSSYGRPSTTGRISLAAADVFAAQRHRRAGSHVSSHRSGSVDRFGRPSRAGTEDGLDAAYPEAEMLQDEGYLEEGDEVVETFSLEVPPLPTLLSRPPRYLSDAFSIPCSNRDKATRPSALFSSSPLASRLVTPLLSTLLSFLEYLKKMVVELPKHSPALNEEGEDEAEPLLSIDFSVLVPVESCTPSAAAKGFYQCLVLCTKDLVGLSQEEDFGEITVKPK